MACGVFAATATANAQDYERNIFGIRAGVNVSTVHMKTSGADYFNNVKSRAGFTGGFSYQGLLMRTAPLYIETGLYYSMKGFKAKEHERDGAIDYGVWEQKANPSYLQVPLMLNYQFQVGRNATIQPAVGVYYAIGLGGKLKSKYDNGEDQWEDHYYLFKKTNVNEEGSGVSHEQEKIMKRSDFGMRFQLGATIGRFYMAAGYDLGLINVLKEKGVYADKMQTRNFNFVVGWNF